MQVLLVVGVGGFVGAIARYSLSGLVHRFAKGPFPAGTLAVNVLGCLIIGVVMELVQRGPLLGPQTRLFVTVGLLGSFTTFSSLGYETVELLRAGDARLALCNLVVSVVLGLGAVTAGQVIARSAAS